MSEERQSRPKTRLPRIQVPDNQRRRTLTISKIEEADEPASRSWDRGDEPEDAARSKAAKEAAQALLTPPPMTLPSLMPSSTGHKTSVPGHRRHASLPVETLVTFMSDTGKEDKLKEDTTESVPTRLPVREQAARYGPISPRSPSSGGSPDSMRSGWSSGFGHRRNQNSIDAQLSLQLSRPSSPGVSRERRRPHVEWRNPHMAELLYRESLEQTLVSAQRELVSLRSTQKSLMRMLTGDKVKGSKKRAKKLEQLMKEDFSSDEEETDSDEAAKEQKDADRADAAGPTSPTEEVTRKDTLNDCFETCDKVLVASQKQSLASNQVMMEMYLVRLRQIRLSTWVAKDPEKYRQMLVLAEKATEAASAMNDQILVARCKFWQGATRYALKEWDAAVDLFEQSEPAAGPIFKVEDWEHALQAARKSRDNGREEVDANHINSKKLADRAAYLDATREERWFNRTLEYFKQNKHKSIEQLEAELWPSQKAGKKQGEQACAVSGIEKPAGPSIQNGRGKAELCRSSQSVCQLGRTQVGSIQTTPEGQTEAGLCDSEQQHGVSSIGQAAVGRAPSNDQVIQLRRRSGTDSSVVSSSSLDSVDSDSSGSNATNLEHEIAEAETDEEDSDQETLG